MKKMNLLLMVGLFSFNLFAQVDTISTQTDTISAYIDSVSIQADTITTQVDTISTQKFSISAQVDTIYSLNGEILPVNIKEITEKSVKFSYPNEDFLITISNNSILKIRFKSGRIQEFVSHLNLKSVNSCLDWENVQISNIESEVNGLMKIKNIGAKAKGMTGLSSLAKLQDRAFNKLKMQAAMMGGNIIYIIEQNTEDALWGGKYSSSKSPSVTISGICYTSTKVKKSNIIEGTYKITKLVELRANSFNLEDQYISSINLDISKDNIVEKNLFLTLNASIKEVNKITEFTIIHSNKNEIVLSGVYTTKNGKKTYYNVFLKK